HFTPLGLEARETIRRTVARVTADLSQQERASAGFEALRHARADDAAPASLTYDLRPSSGPRADAVAGTYTVTLRRSDPRAGWLDWRPGVNQAHMELRLGDGRAVMTDVAPNGRREIAFDESLHVFRDRMAFGGESGPPITARWVLHGDQLRFTIIDGGPADRFVWGTHAWVRTGR